VSTLPARLRSFLTLGLSDRLDAIGESCRALDRRLDQIAAELASVKRLIRRRDDRAQDGLRTAFSSLVNVLAILPELGIKGVLPPFPHRGFEITGEEAAFLFHLLSARRPKVAMELGSGSSTVLIAATLRAHGGGRLISVEHDAEHVRHTATLLQQAGLADRVTLVHAPLVALTLGERRFQWYDRAAFAPHLTEAIDFLLVDGPPGKTQPLSRFPALPVLAPHLRPGALVYVDDAERDDEARMLALWEEEPIAFEKESFPFLPHAPVLLTMRESRVAALGPRDETPAKAQAG
jgi:predicted O-methyltransferase YrrM